MYELLVGDPPYYHEDLNILYKNIRLGNLTYTQLLGNLQIPSNISGDAKEVIHSFL
jgi:hypothetical protein